jgi:hypothetical protein
MNMLELTKFCQIILNIISVLLVNQKPMTRRQKEVYRPLQLLHRRHLGKDLGKLRQRRRVKTMAK